MARFYWAWTKSRIVIMDRRAQEDRQEIASCGSAYIAQLIVDALNANVRARA